MLEGFFAIARQINDVAFAFVKRTEFNALNAAIITAGKSDMLLLL